jgi:hypothetical protein
VTDDSGLLTDQSAAREDSEIWNSTNIESSRQSLLLVGIDFEDDGMARHVAGCTRNFRGGSPAWSAPFGPEVDKDRNLCILDDLVEQLIVRLKRLVDRRKWNLARAATACVREVLRANTIFLTTALADSYRRHRHLRSDIESRMSVTGPVKCYTRRR